jgi:hypothetical protein
MRSTWPPIEQSGPHRWQSSVSDALAEFACVMPAVCQPVSK